MIRFKKEDLFNTHYVWKDGTSETANSWMPTRKAFDPYSGEQVLSMINYYASLLDDFTLDLGRNIESLFLSDLPMETRSEMTVFSWLQNQLREKDRYK